ncbi:MAG: N-acetyltransferase, partial [Litorimonas sp.]
LEALKGRVAASPVPVFALGGITDANAARLRGTGIAGIASIGGLAQILRTQTMTRAPAPADSPGVDPIDADPASAVTIHKEEGGETMRFTAEVRGSSAQGELTLRRVADGVWNANHTGVPSEIGGRGVGKALVAALVEDARQQGYRVVPGCPFVAKLFERRAEWGEVAHRG